MQHFFIGVDGGATKSLVRIENAQGECLSKAISGPANIRLSVDLAWHSINDAIAAAQSQIGLIPNDTNNKWHVGMGLAGCEVEEAYQAFLARKNSFTTLLVSSDAHIACLGAHNGANGAIIIIGTGVVGFQTEDNHLSKVGGWGFPYDDAGSGAWMGLQAIKETLYWYDGRRLESHLVRAVFQYFNENLATILDWANAANSTAFATLAPIVVQSATRGDLAAVAILQQAAKEIDLIYQALRQKQKNPQLILPYALIGGVAAFIEPYLSDSLRQQLRTPVATPDSGAIQLVKNFLANQKDIM